MGMEEPVCQLMYHGDFFRACHPPTHLVVRMHAELQELGTCGSCMYHAKAQHTPAVGGDSGRPSPARQPSPPATGQAET